jgi:hypothetical protein
MFQAREERERAICARTWTLPMRASSTIAMYGFPAVLVRVSQSLYPYRNSVPSNPRRVFNWSRSESASADGLWRGQGRVFSQVYAKQLRYLTRMAYLGLGNESL